jgi:hypothetical protein
LKSALLKFSSLLLEIAVEVKAINETLKLMCSRRL